MRRPSRKVADAGTSGIGKDEKEFAAGGDVDGVRRRRMRTKITNEGLQPPPPVLPLREGGRGEGRKGEGEREQERANYSRLRIHVTCQYSYSSMAKFVQLKIPEKQGPAGQRCVRMALKRHKGFKKA